MHHAHLNTQQHVMYIVFMPAKTAEDSDGARKHAELPACACCVC